MTAVSNASGVKLKIAAQLQAVLLYVHICTSVDIE